MRTYFSFSKTALLLTILFINITLFSQIQRLYYIDDFKLLDSAKYEITYEVEKVINIEKPDDKETDIQKLLIGKKMSKSYSYLLFQNDSICTILEKQGRNFPTPPSGAGTYEIYKHYETGKLGITKRVDETVFRYEENKPVFNWIIKSEQKTILNYPCQLATTEFRGRKYEAWFTIVIPISEGPYKFGGLPGLILSIQDTHEHFLFTCIGIKKLNPLQLIKTRNWNYTETSRKKLHDFLVRKYKNPAEYFNSRGVTYAVKIDGKVVFNPKDYSLPFNPIELE